MPSSTILTTTTCSKKMLLPWAVWICLLFTGGIPLQAAGRPLKLNTTKTIITKDGDIFDCVGIYEQPTFSLKLLANHEVQMRPSSYPVNLTSGEMDMKDKNIHSQLGLSKEDGGGCPKGTVPVQRTAQNNTSLMMPTSLSKKNSPSSYENYWAEIQTIGGVWHGGAAGINVYGVPEVGPRQVSSSLIWVINRQAGAALKVGWTVHPELFGDTNTRLFISWSVDGERTQCYNLKCPGFVQVSPSSPIGQILRPLSVYQGQQYIIRVYIFKDPRTGNWWFSYGTPTNYVGYWPREMFNNFDHATEIHYGGYVGCYADERRCPPMGNGQHPAAQRDSACFVQEVRYFDEYMRLQDVTSEKQFPYANKPECYDVGAYRYVGGAASHLFTFGGPGCFYY